MIDTVFEINFWGVRIFYQQWGVFSTRESTLRLTGWSVSQKGSLFSQSANPATLMNGKSLLLSSVYSTVYSTVYNTLYSEVFTTRESTLRLTGWSVSQKGSLFSQSANPATLMNGNSLLFSSVYSTVYSTVYNTLYSEIFTKVQIFGLSRDSLGCKQPANEANLVNYSQ